MKTKYKRVTIYNKSLNSDWIDWFERYRSPVMNTFWDVFIYCLCNTSYMDNIERDMIKNGEIKVFYIEEGKI